MVKLQSFNEIFKASNNMVNKSDIIKEKLECVPYAWIYIVSERIEEYIEKHLTDKNGIVNVEELNDRKYPFYVKINNTNHTHVDTKMDTYRQFYTKGVATYDGIEMFEFQDDKVGAYSLQALRHLYFTKNVTLRLKHRFQNEFSDKSSNESLMRMRENGNYSALTDLENIIAKDMYADLIFKITWAGADNPPEWYYPCPETDVELRRAQEVAFQIINSKKINVNQENSIRKSIGLSPEFMNKI